MAAEIQDEMQRIFGDFARGVEIYEDEMPLLASDNLPEDVYALATSMEANEYIDGEALTGTRHQLIYGAWGFEEANGDLGIISQMKADGGLPEGTYEIGEHLIVDNEGAFGEGTPGAVYAVSSDYDVDTAEKVSDSILELLREVSAPG